MTQFPLRVAMRFSVCLAFAGSACADEPLVRPLIRSAPGDAPSESTPASTPPARPEGEAPPPHPLIAAIDIVRSSREALESVDDYEATLTKRELVGGTLVAQSMHMKFREEPFSVYLHFLGENMGREVMFVKGRYQNQILAHEGPGSVKSLFGTVSLSPNSTEVQSESRHVITEIGLRNMLDALMERWENESRYGECEVKYYHEAKLGDVPCLAIECTHPQPRRQFPFHMTRLFIERQRNIPIRIENHGFPRVPGAPPPLIEEYTYTNLKVNVGLADRDFDRNNPAYGF